MSTCRFSFFGGRKNNGGWINGWTHMSTFTCTHRLIEEKSYTSKFSTWLRILRPYYPDWCHRNQKTRGTSTEVDSFVSSKHMYALNYSHPPTTGNHPPLVQISRIILLPFLCLLLLFIFQFHTQGTAQGGTSGVRQTSEKNHFHDHSISLPG